MTLDELQKSADGNAEAKKERDRLMLLLDAEAISHIEPSQRALRHWARSWINAQGKP